MPSSDNNLIISDLRGGRNGIDSPLELANNQCAEALNVDWTSPLGEKRRGAVAVATTGGTSFASGVRSMFRHVPNGDETLAELWGVDGVGLFKRMAGGTAWANVTLDDAISGNYSDVHFATLDGKLFIAYNSAVDRLHVWDSALSVVRRVGLAAPGVPTVANHGAGTYAATLRYYRVRVLQLDGVKVVRRSEPSPSVSFTPSGAGAEARVTLGTLPNERETHWEVEVSIDDEEWFVLAGQDGADPSIVIATTTYDDDMVEADYLDLETAEGVGEFTLPKSCKYLSTDQNRLLMFGNWEDTALSSRVFWTPVLGSSDHGDSERVIITDEIQGFADLNTRDGGAIMGAAYPLQGTVYVFKYRAIWKMVPTGNADAPYITRKIHDSIGTIHAKSIVMAEDSAGNPTVAFLSHKGPYQCGVQGGIQHIGRDIDDIWFGENGQEAVGGVNLEASIVVAHGVFHTDMNQIWWFLSVGSYNSPSVRIVLDVNQNIRADAYGLRGGWAYHTGKGCKALCSVMFANTLGAAMSRDLKPYIGYAEPT